MRLKFANRNDARAIHSFLTNFLDKKCRLCRPWPEDTKNSSGSLIFSTKLAASPGPDWRRHKKLIFTYFLNKKCRFCRLWLGDAGKSSDSSISPIENVCPARVPATPGLTFPRALVGPRPQHGGRFPYCRGRGPGCGTTVGIYDKLNGKSWKPCMSLSCRITGS